MLRKSLSALCLITAIMVAAIGSNWAAVPWSVVKDWRDKAPEVVDITVLSLDTTSSTRPFDSMCPGGSETTTN